MSKQIQVHGAKEVGAQFFKWRNCIIRIRMHKNYTLTVRVKTIVGTISDQDLMPYINVQLEYQFCVVL